MTRVRRQLPSREHDQVESSQLRWLTGELWKWWQANYRSFPWRDWCDPYRLLVAEVLLRQTRAQTVSEFMPGFLASYPTPRSIGDAPVPALVERLRPLGFSVQRASQLKALGGEIAAHGDDPWSHGELAALPGVGPYGAGMVGAVLGLGTPAVDTNVARVICRVFDLQPSHAEPRKSTNVWHIAAELVKVSPGAAQLTWAVLDLAALLCVPRKPRCAACPLLSACAYGEPDPRIQ